MSSYKSDKCMRKDEMSTDPKHVQVILWLASKNMQTPKISMKISGYPPRKKPAFIRVFLRDNAGHHDNTIKEDLLQKEPKLTIFHPILTWRWSGSQALLFSNLVENSWVKTCIIYFM